MTLAEQHADDAVIYRTSDARADAVVTAIGTLGRTAYIM